MSDIAERACRKNLERTTTQLIRERNLLDRQRADETAEFRYRHLDVARAELAALQGVRILAGSHARRFATAALKAGGLHATLRDDALDELKEIERIAADLRQNIAETAPRAAPVRLQAAE